MIGGLSFTCRSFFVGFDGKGTTYPNRVPPSSVYGTSTLAFQVLKCLRFRSVNGDNERSAKAKPCYENCEEERERERETHTQTKNQSVSHFRAVQKAKNGVRQLPRYGFIRVRERERRLHSSS